MRASWLSILWLCLGAYAFVSGMYHLWLGDGQSLLFTGAGLACWHESALRSKP